MLNSVLYVMHGRSPFLKEDHKDKAVIYMQALIESVEVVEGNVNDRFLFQNRKHFH